MKENTPQSHRAAAYRIHVQRSAPKSRLLPNCIRAFFVGGAICCLGQVLRHFALQHLLLGLDGAGAFTCVVLIFLGALFTALGLYDDLGRFAGAGSVVPITGFANSMVSPAMEFRPEGLITGTGVRLFTVAGPVLVNGITAAALVGAVKYLLQLLGG